jgi:hypothetical protein
MYSKEIVYESDIHVFAMYLDGELVGFARTHKEAEITLNRLVRELVDGWYLCEAA